MYTLLEPTPPTRARGTHVAAILALNREAFSGFLSDRGRSQITVWRGCCTRCYLVLWEINKGGVLGRERARETTEREREGETDREREKERQTEREKERQTERDRVRHRTHPENGDMTGALTLEICVWFLMYVCVSVCECVCEHTHDMTIKSGWIPKMGKKTKEQINSVKIIFLYF